MIRSVRGLVGALALAGALGCGDEGDAGGGAAQVTFTRDVHPILLAKCGTAGCHDMPNLYQPGHGAADVAVAYESATGLGSVGEPIYERILIRTNSPDPASIMPPNYAGCAGALGQPGCLTQAEYDTIEAWVEQGHRL